VVEPVRTGRTYVVTANRSTRHERTTTVRSAVHTTSGRLVAKASAVWTAIADGQLSGTPGAGRRGGQSGR